MVGARLRRRHADRDIEADERWDMHRDAHMGIDMDRIG